MLLWRRKIENLTNSPANLAILFRVPNTLMVGLRILGFGLIFVRHWNDFGEEKSSENIQSF